MRKIFMLSIANMRKGKGQTAAFFIMILIGTLLFNLGLITWLNFGDNFNKKCKELNSEHSLIVVPKKDYSDNLYDYIKSNKKVTAAEKRDVIFVRTTFSYGSGDLSMATVFTNLSDALKLGKISFVEKTDKVFESPIYLPYLLKTGGGYRMGDYFHMLIGKSTYTYTVAGFYEDMFLGSTNTGIMGMAMDDTTYHNFEQELGDSSQGVLLLSQIDDINDSLSFTSDICSYINKQADNISYVNSISYSLVKTARSVTANIGTMIVVAFSLIIVLISLIVIKFRITNSIDDDMQNIGALKAIGYTSKQIILSISLQFIGISVVGIIIGTALSYVVLPLLSSAYAAQSGILWNQGFDLVSMLITISVILGMVLLTSFISTRKIRNLHPIIALRNGIHTHNFRMNYLPLERFKGNLNILLSLKSSFQNIKQNIMIGLIIAAISFASMFAGIMYYNIAINNEAFLKTIVGEMANVSLVLNPENYDNNLIEKVRKMEEVEKALYFDQKMVTTDGYNAFLYVTEDYSKTENVMCYEGRNPKHDNEVAIGGVMAKDLGKKVGDTITFQLSTIEKEYLITGFIQSGNGMGYDVEITTGGYKRLQPNYQPTIIYIYLKENMQPDIFIKKVTNLYGSQFSESMDFAKMIDSQLGVYTKIVGIFVVIIALITFGIVSLILYLVVKTMIIRKKRELGIQKALGFTTTQLILQLSLSFLPVVAIGTILGGTVGYIGTNPMITVLFRSFGIMRMEFIIQPALIIGLCISICVLAFLVSILVSMRIRKISAYALIQE